MEENAENNPCCTCRILLAKARLLFAEELLQYIMEMNAFNVSLISSERYRNLVHNAFTENVMMSVVYLEEILIGDVIDTVLFLEQRDLITSEGFERYSRSLVSNFVEEGENAVSILKTCVRIAFTAVFYYEEGIETAPHTAIAVIADAIDYDLSRGGWKMVQDAAVNFENMHYAIANMLSPSTDGERSPEDDQRVIR